MCILGRVWIKIFIWRYTDTGDFNMTKRFRYQSNDEVWYVCIYITGYRTNIIVIVQCINVILTCIFHLFHKHFSSGLSFFSCLNMVDLSTSFLLIYFIKYFTLNSPFTLKCDEMEFKDLNQNNVLCHTFHFISIFIFLRQNYQWILL